MKNTTEIPYVKSGNLKITSIILTVIAIVFSIVVIIISLVITKNLSGEVHVVEVSVKEITHNDDTHKLVADDGQEYMISSLNDKIEWDSYVGKTVTLVIPFEQFSGDPWILGLVDGEETVIDYNETIAERKSENTIVVSVFSAVIGLLLIGAVVCYLFYRKTPKTRAQSIDDCVWQVFASNLPKSPKRNKFGVIILVWAVIILAFCILMAFFGDKIESDFYGGLIAGGFCSFFALGLFLELFLAFYVLPKDEIRFYKENYPFNADDVSHCITKKTLRKFLNEKNKAERIAHPDNFPDYGNGLATTFQENGLYLYYEEYDNEMETQTSGVFEEYDDANATNKIFEYTIPYEKLHLVAIPKYRKYANMFGIIIKSRLDENESYPEDIQFDIHFLLDSNLLTTLKKFNVEVEGLDYLLNNVDKLMQENCKKAKSGLKRTF